MKTIIIDEIEYNLTPKVLFKKGDWVVIDGEVLHVKEVTEDGYLTDEGRLIPFRNEKEAHLWTIQDAKDGDVLVDKNNNIGIFQKCKGIYWNSYIYLGCDGKFRSFSIGGSHVQNGTYPATKEQRNLLFAKMKEAGYEWDADKKELKRIEDEIEIPYGSKDSELQEATYYIPKGFYAEIDDDKVVIKKGEKPTAWSEEDIVAIDCAVEVLSKDLPSLAASIERLKSLKARYTWKPSDEQIIELRRVISGCSYDIEPLAEMEEQLKKLREG